MLRSLAISSLLLTLALTPGCVAAVAGAAVAGTVQFARNEAFREYPATVEATWSATLEAMRDLAYPVDPSVKYGQNGGTLQVNDVRVGVLRSKGNMTRVTVRIGTFATQEHKIRAKNILNGVARRLGVGS